jgi:class 3 adenylate cyclase
VPKIKFCGDCGKPLATAGKEPAQPDPRAYTPKHLVEKILTSRSALEGERKQVTILFADVKGSTELASELDPEEWHGIMDRFFQILAEGVHRFGGTVNEYRGDGIMALFGAPIAHEDHAQRACYSALHLRDALRRYADDLRMGRGISFAVRMGLNSGEVVVGKIGDDLRMDYTALGHAANLAARRSRSRSARRPLRLALPSAPFSPDASQRAAKPCGECAVDSGHHKSIAFGSRARECHCLTAIAADRASTWER